MKNVLIINAHQFWEGMSTGELNNAMAGVIKEEMEKRGYEVKQNAHVERDIMRLRDHLKVFINHPAQLKEKKSA